MVVTEKHEQISKTLIGGLKTRNIMQKQGWVVLGTGFVPGGKGFHYFYVYELKVKKTIVFHCLYCLFHVIVIDDHIIERNA